MPTPKDLPRQLRYRANSRHIIPRIGQREPKATKLPIEYQVTVPSNMRGYSRVDAGRSG